MARDPLPYSHPDRQLPPSLEHAIGEFVIEFSGLEYVLVLLTAKLLAKDDDYVPVIFSCKRLAADAKREMLVRAVKELGSAETRELMMPSLGQVKTLIERRNDLLHGTFMQGADTDGGPRQHVGRIGGVNPEVYEEVTIASVSALTAEAERIKHSFAAAFGALHRNPRR